MLSSFIRSRSLGNLLHRSSFCLLFVVESLGVVEESAFKFTMLPLLFTLDVVDDLGDGS